MQQAITILLNLRNDIHRLGLNKDETIRLIDQKIIALRNLDNSKKG